MKWFVLLLFIILLIGCKDQGTGMAAVQNKIEVKFCPEQDCNAIFASEISTATKVHCALYNFEGVVLKELEKQKEAKAFSDDNYKKKLGYLSFVRFDERSSLMHNKFCILDDSRVITGSFNPVANAKSDINNMVYIFSPSVAAAYEDEFQELWSYNKNTKSKITRYGDLDVYFCPEDDCSKHVINEIKKANESIKFMVYSFTDLDIATELVKRMHGGIIIKGMYEENQLSNFSTYNVLKFQGAEVLVYKQKGILHSKVFIIDDSTVITGSYNPTMNGNKNNDENIIIIHDAQIAKAYSDEFNRIETLINNNNK